MSQTGPGWWIPVKMILQFTARGKENGEFKSSYLRGSYAPSACLGSVKLWSSGFLHHVVQWFFSCVASTFRVTDFGSSAHKSDWEKEKCWLGSFKDFGQSKLRKGESPANVAESANWGRWHWVPFIRHRSYILFLYNQSTSSSQSLLHPSEPNCHHKDEGSMFLQNMRTNPLYLRVYKPRRPPYE